MAGVGSLQEGSDDLQITLDLPTNFISIMIAAINLSAFIFFMRLQYRKLDVKPALWKVGVAGGMGILAIPTTFTYSFSIRLAAVPIGVWLIYLVIRHTSWPRYRRFAWTGFWLNYLFLITTIIAHLLTGVFYAKTELGTYLASTEEAYVVRTHSSAPDASLDIDRFNAALLTAERQQRFPAIEWHSDSVRNGVFYGKERFPYMLGGVEPKWGSGTKAVVFVEYDGKGLMIVDGENNLYVRSQDYFIVPGGDAS